MGKGHHDESEDRFDVAKSSLRATTEGVSLLTDVIHDARNQSRVVASYLVNTQIFT